MKNLSVTSPAFENGGLIPVEYTGYGADRSPELHLGEIETGAQSLAVIMNDLDHPIRGYNHWVLWNLPVLPVIPADIPCGARVEALGGAKQGIGYGKHRYAGPKPPFNWSHKYEYNVYVLDTRLDLPDTTRKRALLQAMQGHILQHGVLLGHYR